MEATDFDKDAILSLRVVDQKLFPPKAKRHLPFSVVKAGEKKGLKVTVRVEPGPVAPPECRLTDQDGNEVPWIQGSPTPQIVRQSYDTFVYEFELGYQVGIFRVKFIAEETTSCWSQRFAIVRNTGKDRPEMKQAFCSLLWLSFQDQLDNSLESALRYVSEGLQVWLGVPVLRSAADIGWFIRQAPHLESGCVTEDKVFRCLIESLRKRLQLIEPSESLSRLWSAATLVLPLFLEDSALDQLLADEGDFALRMADRSRKFKVVWRYQGAIRYCLLEWQTMARGGEKLWEIASDPLFGRIKHTAIDSLPRLLDEFAQLRRFVFIDPEVGHQCTLPKQELTLRLAAQLGEQDASPDDEGDDASEEVLHSVSITAELEDLQRPFNLDYPLPSPQ